MTQTVDAVFENGTFRLLDVPATPLMEGQHVRLTIEAEVAPEDILALAGEVYEGLSPSEINEVEQIVLDRRRFFDESRS